MTDISIHGSATRRWGACVFFFALGLTLRTAGQELSLLGGGMRTDHESSYSYQADYRQNFTRYTAASVAYINEGHIPGHHRDGTAFELLGRLPLFKDRIAFAAGAGVYFFYDTQPVAGGDTANIHGSAVVYSVSTTSYLSNRWFLRAMANRIAPTHEFQSTTAMLGLGFWFGQEEKPTKGKMGTPTYDEGYHYVTDPELTLFVGRSIVNTLESETARMYAAEFRRGFAPHIDWTISGIYEGPNRKVRRNGLAAQVWAVNTFFTDRISVGAGLGPYLFVDGLNPQSRDQQNPAALAPLVSFTVAARLNDHWVARLIFNRVTTSYNRDADALLIGLGYRFGVNPL